MTPPRPPAKKSPPRPAPRQGGGPGFGSAFGAGRGPAKPASRGAQAKGPGGSGAAGRKPAPLPPPEPLAEHEIDALQALLDSLPPSHDALDVMSLDGYLAGVLLQPELVPEPRWLAHITDVDGKPAPSGFDTARLQQLVRRRHAELALAIAERDWFDPWVYELEDEAEPSEVVMPWVAGFATAVDLFPALMDRFEPQLTEPLALLYRHLDPEDLEDADELLAEIETIEPPESLDEAVEDLVRATLLIADVSLPQDKPAGKPAARPGARPGAPRRPGPPRR
ncbi:YecA/YgfB family protein [Aquabacterium sp. OR-4]|uniref:YecA/YgfB family protein n=1 Tax=Aquabacterium sp. OR-4 TaxID=2978127 RepID=UPI0028C5475F|nr:UPF0149 family protein [Aquabacterium sp. OR-4]MDT7833708.1 UPF0149 family protein [Aquabacterium sp. OR-4]